jgi:hypothetical protein
MEPHGQARGPTPNTPLGVNILHQRTNSLTGKPMVPLGAGIEKEIKHEGS